MKQRNYGGIVNNPSFPKNIRFLSVAEQFQVRGLVENFPKGVPTSGASTTPQVGKFPIKNPAKRPRVVKEDLSAASSGDDYEASYQPLGQEGAPGSTMVGLVCPKCRQMCRGVAALKSHMAVCPEQQRPVGQVAPAQRTRGMSNKPQGVQNFPKLANNPNLGISKVGGSGPSTPASTSSPMFNQRQTRRASSSAGGPSTRQGTTAPAQQRGVKGGKGKPNLTEIGHKLGLAVSITSVASNSPRKGVPVMEDPTQPNAEHIKEEPVEVEEPEVLEEEQEYVDEEYNQENEEYDGEMDGYGEGGEMEDGEYGEGEGGYPGYEDYTGGQEGSGQMFKKFRD